MRKVSVCLSVCFSRLLLTDVVRDRETAAIKEPREAEEEANSAYICMYVCMYVPYFVFPSNGAKGTCY